MRPLWRPLEFVSVAGTSRASTCLHQSRKTPTTAAAICASRRPRRRRWQLRWDEATVVDVPRHTRLSASRSLWRLRRSLTGTGRGPSRACLSTLRAWRPAVYRRPPGAGPSQVRGVPLPDPMVALPPHMTRPTAGFQRADATADAVRAAFVAAPLGMVG
eukprot:TRINITY_DN14326_c0_g1_i1.p2 TRINITY_DN14326_c0_g1~~TRINITY_DN14326_c0_g1_i1.p2  ORF type:complete len:159 (-),score=10.94 TRINITY_DN14326_c0_g1_i1:374-850(-)